jgi:O-antigen/teichoic acid export membrane protein
VIRRTLSTHGLPILDQGLSSGTNFLAVFVLAGSLSSGEFGIFAMAYTVLTLFVGVTRSFFGLPLALAAQRSRAELDTLYRSSVSALCWIALPIVGVVFGVGAISAIGAEGSSMSLGLWAALAVAVATPLVMIQDISRYYAISIDQPGAAVISDAIWLVSIVVLFGLREFLEPATVVVVWTIAIVAALAYFLIRFVPRPAPRGGLQLLRPKRGLRESISITVILSTGVTLVMGFLMLPFLGAAAVGSIRGAGTLFGPVNTLMALLDFSVLSQLSRRDRLRDGKTVLLLSIVVCGISAAWAGVLLLLPQRAGEFILGDTWAGARSILPITSVEYVLLCLAACFALIPKLRDRARVLLLNRVWATLTILSATVVALLLGGGVEWMAAALLLGAFVSTVGLLWDSRSEFRRDPR